MHAIDFIRLHLDSAKKHLFIEGEAFFNENSPLVMCALNKVGDNYDLELVREFEGRGYKIFRLISGLQCLVPFVDESELGVFALNLFACKPDRAELLKRDGVLIDAVQTLSALPTVNSTAWQEYMSRKPETESILVDWIAAKEKYDHWETYWVGLHLFALAHDDRNEPAYRHACLQAAFGIVTMLVQYEPRIPRVITLIRIMIDLDRREQAVHLMNELFSAIGSPDLLALDEPFTPVTDSFIMPADRKELAGAVFVDLLVQRERLRAFSSYFTGRESLPVLQEIRTFGGRVPEVERRMALIAQRYNL